MRKHYVLYIDILGFSEMVHNRPEDVRRIFWIIENLNCHSHDAFKVIVFSDTVLIYNKLETFGRHDETYTVMYLIEFAQNLLYECIGKGFYFRAVLVEGEFEHNQPNNVERFFGKALVDAYLAEKDIKCTGLFISTACNKANEIFSTAEAENDFHFVYMNQSLDRLGETWGFNNLPVPGCDLEDYLDPHYLAKDVHMLRDIHKLKADHPDAGTREKHSSTWNFYEKRYLELLTRLVLSDFSLSTISADLDWSVYEKNILYGYRGHGIDPPPQDELLGVLSQALDAGNLAGKAAIEKFGLDDRFRHPCGGAMLYLDVDGRTAIAKAIKRTADSIERMQVDIDYRGKGLSIHFPWEHSRQEELVDTAASEAALDVLRQGLHVDGFVERYWT